MSDTLTSNRVDKKRPSELEVFISHGSSPRERELARKIAEGLDERNINYFLDMKDLHGGDLFEDKILDQVHQARVVVVLVKGEMSSWVQFEAACAYFDKKLAPVSVDDTEVPQPYRQRHHLSIRFDDGDQQNEPEIENVVGEVQRRVHGEGIDNAITKFHRRANSLFFSGIWILLAIVSAAILIVSNRLATDTSYFYLNHLHVTFGAVILGGQFFLSLSIVITNSPAQ